MITGDAANPWIETFRGHKFHALNPTPEEIDIEDIAHALSNQCRFTGHIHRFVSVAEHSYYASLLADKPDKLAGLLHDASEAYLVDMARPWKHHTPIGPPYQEIESKVMEIIAEKYGFAWPLPESVKKADEQLLWMEKAQLLSSLAWENCGYCGEEVRAKANDFKIVGYAPPVIEKIFLQRFFELT
jgi:5'-deoxynucleotidase YfbR-like HD superfamily hydrolase